jgi:sterol desaturase/sphingolipid hydroxylase (fatty acid hydroxylase superfamily)
VKQNLIHKMTARAPIFSLILSLMCLGAILCFLFPEYLTTPEIRKNYPIPLLRELLKYSLIVSSMAAFVGVIFTNKKFLSTISMMILGLSQYLGGSQVHLKPEYNNFKVQIGLDWFLLDLFILALLFIPLEAFFPQKKDQATIRPEFKIDLTYFMIGHLGIQFLMILTQRPVHIWMNQYSTPLQFYKLPIYIQIFCALIISDFVQYWIHRIFHIVKPLWKFHKIHHSIKSLDWLAGSRLHLLDIFIVRLSVFAMVTFLNLDPVAFNGYVIVLAFQTVFIHSNINFDIHWLNYFIVLPKFHHWHHNDRPISYDKNFCVHFPVWDHLFRTFYLPKEWPSEYGIEEDQYPDSYLGQFIYPFKSEDQSD